MELTRFAHQADLEFKEEGFTPENPLKHQIGGSHYKHFIIQPLEFIYLNNIPYAEANCIKYICRYKEKGGIEDLRKARHYIDFLIQQNISE